MSSFNEGEAGFDHWLAVQALLDVGHVSPAPPATAAGPGGAARGGGGGGGGVLGARLRKVIESVTKSRHLGRVRVSL